MSFGRAVWFGKDWGGGHQDWHLFSVVPLWLCSERAGGSEATEPGEKKHLW